MNIAKIKISQREIKRKFLFSLFLFGKFVSLYPTVSPIFSCLTFSCYMKHLTIKQRYNISIHPKNGGSVSYREEDNN